LEWDDAAITGVSRWLNRLWSLVQPLSEIEPEQLNVRQATPQLDLELNSKLNETIARVTQAFGFVG
jgi:leucyl-tRNA synthetase